MINDFFAGIYETIFGISEVKFSLIFTTLFNDWGYIKLGLIFILIPLISWAFFYWVWRYPYGKLIHWILWWIILAVVVFASTWAAANTIIFASDNQQLIDALNDPDSGYNQFASDLPYQYAIINAGLSLALGFIFSLGMKQRSRIQMHLPF